MLSYPASYRQRMSKNLWVLTSSPELLARHSRRTERRQGRNISWVLLVPKLGHKVAKPELEPKSSSIRMSSLPLPPPPPTSTEVYKRGDSLSFLRLSCKKIIIIV